MNNDQFRSVTRTNTHTATSAHFHRHSAEKSLMAFLSLGNHDLLSGYLENSNMLGQRPDIPLTQAKYQGSTLLSLAQRTAIDVGVPEYTTRPIVDFYTEKFDSMEDSTEQWQITQEALMQFCEAIHEAKLSCFNGAIRQCCEYIDRNIHTSISLDELGQVCHLSPHYVSDIFRKETGIGALQFVHQAKMQYAKFFLENTDQGIAEIALFLSYPSHSNFSQRFKKVYGITPHEFRASCGR